jgi:hypothetical protein
MSASFVPDDFTVPPPPATPEFRLEPLAPGHNADDHAAWTGSIEHIRATTGFQGSSWPPEAGMTLDQNLDDLRRHADDFAERRGFTYTVLDPAVPPGADGTVIGCVYIYPARTGEHDATVRSWVRADRAGLDEPLHAAVAAWLAAEWPFERIRYRPW